MATLYKRGRLWWARWYRPDGKRVQESTKTDKRREAERIGAELEAADRRKAVEPPSHASAYKKILADAARDADAGRLTTEAAEAYLLEIRRVKEPEFHIPTLKEAMAAWVADQDQRLGGATAKGYKEAQTVVEKVLGAKMDEPLSDFTHAAAGKLLHALKKGRRAATANQHFRAFRRAIQAAVIAKHISHNPAEGIAPLPEADSIERAPFTPAEVTAMLSHEKTSDEWRGLILVGGNTGLREGDAAKLDTKLIENGELVLRPKKTSRKGKANIVRIPLSKPLLKWIGDRQGPLFPALSQLSPQSLWYHFGKIMTAAEVPKKVVVAGKECSRSFHSLRHSFTTWLAEADIHPDVRKALTGHSTDEAHGRYTHHGEALKKAIEKLPVV